MSILLFVTSGGCFFFGFVCFAIAQSTFHEQTGMLSFLCGLVALIGGAILQGNERQNKAPYYIPRRNNSRKSWSLQNERWRRRKRLPENLQDEENTVEYEREPETKIVKVRRRNLRKIR